MNGPAALAARAVAESDPLVGATAGEACRGYAGQLPDGRLVRDPLGREPLYVETEGGGAADDSRAWAVDPTELSAPELVDAGALLAPDGTVERRLSLPAPDPVDPETAVADLSAALDAALAAAPPAAVAFSGGVDSATVAAGVDGPLYVAGFPDGPDVAAARDATRAFDRAPQVVELDHDALRRAVRAVARATGRSNAMDVAIAAPLFLVAERAAAEGHDRLALGQGADELFGGYAKVAKAPDDPRVEADTVRGARDETLSGLPAQLPRDVLAVRAAGVDPVVPLLDDRVVAAALRTPADLLVDERGERKVALRRAARGRVPARVAYREKQAVQYGSRASRELDRLARQAGFKRREDDHVRRYVESLL
jgi:asparagine synthase (glutamine-hydrolysing)